MITFTPHQCMLEGGSSKSKLQKVFRGTQTAWNKYIKPGLKLAAQLISIAIAAKTRNPQSAQITSDTLKTLTGGKILSLTDMHGNGLRFKVLWIISMTAFWVNEWPKWRKSDDETLFYMWNCKNENKFY